MKKTKKMEEVKDTRIELATEESTPIGTTSIAQGNPIEDAEWCFQFFDTDPVVFAWNSTTEPQSNPLVIELKPIEGDGLSFTKDGMIFKIFSRHITEETKIQRQKQMQESDSLKQDIATAENK